MGNGAQLRKALVAEQHRDAAAIGRLRAPGDICQHGTGPLGGIEGRLEAGRSHRDAQMLQQRRVMDKIECGFIRAGLMCVVGATRVR